MQLNNQRDPDANIVALFRQHSVHNEGKSREAGRPIFDDIEVCELRYPGSRNVGVYPANTFSDWVTDPETGEQVKRTYAERFPRQYRQFKEKLVQTKSGTPLDYATFLTEGRRAELRALNIYTVEALAAVDGQELKNLGQMGRDLKNRAMNYLTEARSSAPNLQMEAELKAAQARTAVLEEDMRALRAQLAASQQQSSELGPGLLQGTGNEFDDMTVAQLRDYITANSGHTPKGDLTAMNRRTLIRMAEACKPVSGAA